MRNTTAHLHGLADWRCHPRWSPLGPRPSPKEPGRTSSPARELAVHAGLSSPGHQGWRQVHTSVTSAGGLRAVVADDLKDCTRGPRSGLASSIERRGSRASAWRRHESGRIEAWEITSHHMGAARSANPAGSRTRDTSRPRSGWSTGNPPASHDSARWVVGAEHGSRACPPQGEAGAGHGHLDRGSPGSRRENASAG